MLFCYLGVQQLVQLTFSLYGTISLIFIPKKRRTLTEQGNEIAYLNASLLKFIAAIEAANWRLHNAPCKSHGFSLSFFRKVLFAFSLSGRSLILCTRIDGDFNFTLRSRSIKAEAEMNSS